MHHEEQAAASAWTGREHIQRTAYFPARAERAVRLRDYFALQLHFADVVAAKAALPLPEVVEHYTNFYRRFGFGIWPDAPLVPDWYRYTAHLQTLATHDQRLAWTQTFYAQLPPERLPVGRQQFGCFGCDPPDATGRVRIHFTNHDTDGTSPLSRPKMGVRRQELQALFTYVQQTYAAAAHSVLGGSWLYHLEAYRRLFPPVYGASRLIQEGNAPLQGQTCWGQFVDHRGAVYLPGSHHMFPSVGLTSVGGRRSCGKSTTCGRSPAARSSWTRGCSWRRTSESSFKPRPFEGIGPGLRVRRTLLEEAQKCRRVVVHVPS